MNPQMIMSALSMLKGDSGSSGPSDVLSFIKQNPEITPLAALSVLAGLIPKDAEGRAAFLGGVQKALDGLSIVMSVNTGG